MRHIAKRIVAVVLTMMMVLSLVSWASAADYADMPTNWAKEPMEAAVENGLLQGNNGLLNPNGNLTRAQMAAIVVRAFGMNHYDDLADFTDVKDTDWFVKDNTLGAAYIMGLFQGNGDGRLTPNTAITREAAFAVLARALKLEAGTADDLSKFSDANEVSSWFVGEVAAMAKAGYVNGNDGKLNPKGNITRAQFAQVMFNIFGDYVKEEGTVTEVGGKSVVISADGVTLKGVNVKGDVIIGEGVAEGDVYLDNVKVDGRLIVRGGGINSVHIIGGSSVANIIVAKVVTDVRIVTEGETTSVGTITVVQANSNEEIKDGNVTIEGAAEAVVANSTSTIKLANAKVETVEINAKTEITADNSEIGKATVAAEEAYLTLTNGSSADEVVVTEAAKDAVVNVDAGTTIGKLETSADMTLAGAGTVEEEIANGDVEIKKESEVVERPEEGDSRVHVHAIGDGEYEKFDDKEHYYFCTVTKDGKPCGEIVYEAHKWVDSKWVATYKDGHTGSEVETKPVVDTDATIGDKTDDAIIVSFVVSQQKCSACAETKAVPYTTVTLGDGACDGNHKWVKGETVAATCTAEGTVTYSCSNEVAADDASEGGDPATCTATKVEKTPAIGHRFDKKDATASVAPNCVETGTDVYVCVNPGCCGSHSEEENHECAPATTSITLAATGNHSYTKYVSKDASGHYITCANVKHDGVTLCGAKKQANNDDVVEAHKLSITTVWVKEGSVVDEGTEGATEQKRDKCSVCDYVAGSPHSCPATSDAAKTAGITVVAESHTEGDTTTVHSFTCICGEKKYVDGSHTYDKTPESGNPTGKCTVCGTSHSHATVTYKYTAGTGTDEDQNGIPVDQHGVACETCGYKYNNANHNYNSEGKCEQCEHSHGCSVATAETAANYSFTPATVDDAKGHAATCKTCTKTFAAVACTDANKDNKCDVCGNTVHEASECTDEGHVEGYTVYSGSAGSEANTHGMKCAICGKPADDVACSYTNSRNSEHADYQSGKCDVCGTVHTHGDALKLAAANVTDSDDAVTAYKHKSTCTTCGYESAATACTPNTTDKKQCSVEGCPNASVAIKDADSEVTPGQS